MDGSYEYPFLRRRPLVGPGGVLRMEAEFPQAAPCQFARERYEASVAAAELARNLQAAGVVERTGESAFSRLRQAGAMSSSPHGRRTKGYPMNPSDVRTATAEDRHGIVGAIVLAFARDPVVRWMYPDPHQYLTHFPEFVRAFGGRAFEHDAAHYTGEFSGGALWFPPGVQPDDAALDPLLERTVDPRKLRNLSRIFEEMAGYHPTEPCWYLPLIGVDPKEQGRGHGSALLRFALERVDRERRPAYLENSNPANIPLYERHGFVVVGTIQVEDAPPLIPMIRRAR